MKHFSGFINTNNIIFSDPRVVRTYLLWTRTEFDWEVRDAEKDPLTFIRENGDHVRMFSVSGGVTDFASTPPMVWCVPGFSPVRFVYPATVHDNIYKTHKVRISHDKGLTWVAQAVDQRWTDDLLEEMIEHDVKRGSWFEQEVYRCGVRLGGSKFW